MSEIMRGFIIIRRQRVDPWESVMGGQDECIVFKTREDAEASRSNMRFARDWDVVEVALAAPPAEAPREVIDLSPGPKYGVFPVTPPATLVEPPRNLKVKANALAPPATEAPACEDCGHSAHGFQACRQACLCPGGGKGG